MKTRVCCFVGSLGVLLSVLFSAPGALAQNPDPLSDPVLVGGLPVTLQTVATGLTAPTAGATAPGDNRLFVSDQNGILWAVDLATGQKEVFLDLSARLVNLGIFGPGTFDERGFLGVAFHPDYPENGRLYTYTSEPNGGQADFSTIPPGENADHQSLILEWRVPQPGDPSSVVDPSSAREILRIDQPQFNHNAGALNFAPDGLLYISVGDGGGADDLDGQAFIGGPIFGHGDGNGQNPANILGSVLRIDPLGDDAANGRYGIPVNNPFYPVPPGPLGGENGCMDGFCDEIFAYGFRNPFRFSFDSATGDLYLGDVGQNDLEEVDVVVAGGNYGWNLKEGSFCFDANGINNGFAFDQDPCPNVPPGATLVDPIAEYDTTVDGFSVIGGFVYRGGGFPELDGRYVFGDFSQVFDFAQGILNQGRLFYLKDREVAALGLAHTDIVEFTITARDSQPANALNLSLLGFGQGPDGELYVLGNDVGVPFGETGVVVQVNRDPVGIDEAGVCQPGANTLCLLDGRFEVEVEWEASGGRTGSGNAVNLDTESAGYFWFFQTGNPELMVKVLDGRSFNGTFWVFAGGLTDVGFDLVVTDTVTGFSRTYGNDLGDSFSVIDTQSFSSLE